MYVEGQGHNTSQGKVTLHYTAQRQTGLRTRKGGWVVGSADYFMILTINYQAYIQIW
jgi:hypothetical protein